jgi:hypothetical protein
MPRTKGAKNKHYKEKPVKEKKKRGRKPGSIKQKQEQHQIVNVNINSNSRRGRKRESSEERGKKKKPGQNVVPSIIFNPSINTPSFGFPTNKAEINPPYYDMNSLMQPIQQTIQQTIQNKPIPAPVIKPVDVKPEIINQQPQTQTGESSAEKYTPNPQTDQSHPLITPELIIDSNVSSAIHNKHMQHKEIQPDVPKEIPKPKFKDTEGLGAKIPIQNIGAIASTIATGGALGAATAAGEALLTGGLSGLLGAGENIAASTIGGATASGVNYALGGGPMSQVVSGVAGGVVGRTAMKRIRNRQNNNVSEEAQPLLQNGNRLGGNKKTSRLVNEISETIDPATGERTQWVIPEEEQSTLLNKIKKTVKRTVNDISDTMHNLRQQITGRSQKGGTYARVKQQQEKFERNYNKSINDGLSDETLVDKLIPMPQQHEESFDLTDQNIKDLYKARQETIKEFKAEKIQKVVRGHKARKDVKKLTADRDQLYDLIRRDQYDGNDPLDIENELRNMRKEQENRTRSKELADILARDNAAVKLQNVLKLKQGEKGRHILQKVVRENIERKKTDLPVQKITDQTLQNALKEVIQEDNAATQIKAALRGHKGRKTYKYLKEEYPKIAEVRQQEVLNTTPSTNLQSRETPPKKHQHNHYMNNN